MHIQYREQENEEGGWEAVDEDRPLNYLNADTERCSISLWKRAKPFPSLN